MTAKQVNVYAPDRKTVLTACNAKCTSIGAAKAAKWPSAYMARVNGQMAWGVCPLR